jgi:hypothetical protein
MLLLKVEEKVNYALNEEQKSLIRVPAPFKALNKKVHK